MAGWRELLDSHCHRHAAVDIDSDVQTATTEYVYNFVLNDHHQFLVDGIPVVTLGHNFKGPVVSHPYLGTNLVIDDLKKHPDWESGLITIDAGDFKRDQTTGWFTSLNQPKTEELLA